jgi:iron complex outermembrane receptor protein
MSCKKHSHYLFGLLVVPLLMAGSVTFGQGAVLQGQVKDAVTKETLPGVNIVADSLGGTASDEEGSYELQLSPGNHSIIYSFIGYQEEKISVSLKNAETAERDVYLKPQSIELNTAVISASRYEQRLSDVTVSMEVIPAKYIESTNSYKLDETIGKMPGVDVIDGQANIRGGSGYSYGAGSRVLVLVDELPMLTGDVNDVKWDALPLETIDQVEIVKGASSALYGSSALNGVINLRTASPGTVPATSILVSGGRYMKPKREELAWWWDRNPLIGNLQFSHLRKAGPVDISIGGAGLYDEGYRQDNYEHFGRLNAGIRYNPEKVTGLSVGMNTNIQFQDLSDFLIWQDADSGAWMQNPDAVTPMHGMRFNVDPYAIYFDHRGGRHSLKTRYFTVTNKFDEDPDKDNGSDYFYAEYQYHKKFRNGLHWSAGGAGSYTKGTSNLYGNHYGSTLALYTQLDQKLFDCLSVSLGLRWERYTLDKTDDESKPVLRAGVNWQAAEYTFIRASFGQGYRYPSMAEKYTATSLGALNIIPNPVLEPETGWSTELGVRQGFLIGSWNGFIDVAGFWSEYDNMIEFIFGNYNPDTLPPTLDYVGFKSINTGRARINGVDISISGHGMAGPVSLDFFAGYTYMNPMDLSTDTAGVDTASHQILKYRYHHSAKGDLSATFRKFDAGFTVVYTSFIERIDPAFEDPIFGTGGPVVFPGLKEYRDENDHGSVIVDFRLGWQITHSSKISLYIKNLLNEEAMGRPGDIQPPRSISLQYLLRL